MPVLVVLALVLAVFSIGLVAVAALLLKSTAGALRRELSATSERLEPLLDELQAESAVTANETMHLQRRLAARHRLPRAGGDMGERPG
jgi:Flp pilus assembly protein TadB